MSDLGRLERLTSCAEPAFRELYAIYAAWIDEREQKPEAWLCTMVGSSEYRMLVMKSEGSVVGFSVLFVPHGQGFSLLEYMAVAPEQRNHGMGSEVFRQTVTYAKDDAGAPIPMVLEVDSDREVCGDHQLRLRRQQFYRRLGCVRVNGLHYILPLGDGPVPEMDLMLHRAQPEATVPRAQLERWLRAIYQGVYHRSPDDPRIGRMLAGLPDPIGLD